MKTLILGILISVAAATAPVSIARAGEDPTWKDAAISAMLANAEAVLEAKKLVQSGRAYVGTLEYRIVSDSRDSRVEEYQFEIDASYGDVVVQVGLLTITQTTKFRPRAPMISYESKLVPIK